MLESILIYHLEQLKYDYSFKLIGVCRLCNQKCNWF